MLCNGKVKSNIQKCENIMKERNEIFCLVGYNINENEIYSENSIKIILWAMTWNKSNDSNVYVIIMGISTKIC